MRVKLLIEKYIDNDITSEEMQELSNYLDKPEWKEYFNRSLETEKIIREGFESLLRKKLKQEYEKYETDIPFEQVEEAVLKYGSKSGEERDLRGLKLVQKQKFKCKPLHIWMSIAAAILFCGLLFCCLHFHKITFHRSGNHVYKDYYQKFNLYVTRGPKDYSKFKYFEGVNLYITGKYEESIGICRNLLKDDPSNMDYRFLYALTLMESGLTDQAKHVYIPLIKESIGKNAMIYAISTWHVSLIYLKEDKTDSSLFYLKTFRLEDNLFVDLDKAEYLKDKLMK